MYILSSTLIYHKLFANNQYKTKLGIQTTLWIRIVSSSPSAVQSCIASNGASSSPQLFLPHRLKRRMAMEIHGSGSKRLSTEMVKAASRVGHNNRGWRVGGQWDDIKSN